MKLVHRQVYAVDLGNAASEASRGLPSPAQVKMIKPKFIYFDVGGVLLHFEHIRQLIADDLGISLEDYTSVMKSFLPALAEGKATEADVELELKKRFNLDFPNNFYANNQWVDKFIPIQEMHDLVIKLSKYYRLGLLTNVTKLVWDRAQDISGMYPEVDYEVKIKSFEVGLAKPDPKIYELAIKKTGLSPNEIMLVDDLADNVQTASDLGMQIYRFDTNNAAQNAQFLNQLLLDS
jgi:HAD superfamily hydrolase (TIGR01509 family)